MIAASIDGRLRRGRGPDREEPSFTGDGRERLKQSQLPRLRTAMQEGITSWPNPSFVAKSGQVVSGNFFLSD